MLNQKMLPIILIISALMISACNIPGGDYNNTNSESEGVYNSNQSTDVENPQSDLESTNLGTDEISQSDMESVCYHPYFPISDGATWTFNEPNGQDYTLMVDLTSSDTFTLTQTFEDSELTLEMEWYCSEDGLLNGTFSQVDLLNQMAGEDDPEVILETLEWEGSTLPPAEMLVLGHQWITSYEMRGEMTIENLTTTTEVHVKIENSLGSIEEVKVPSGSFPEAIRVDSVGMIEMVILMGETATPLNGFQFNYSTWYVEGVGMVKSSNEFSGMTSDVVLIDTSLLP